jgi:hypothetical protein
MSNLEYREQIESWMGRPLEPDELLSVATLEDLSPLQLAVVEALAPRNALVAMHYLRAVVTDALVRDLMPFIDRVASAVKDRNAGRKPWS